MEEHTVNPRISPLGAYLFLMLFGWGLIRGGAYKIIRQMSYKKLIAKAPFLHTITRTV